MNRLLLIPWILLLSTMLIGCARESVPLRGLPSSEIKTAEIRTGVEEAWQLKWEKTLAEAKKEGTLVIATGRSEAMRDIIARDFKNKYGLDIQWITVQPAQMMAKISAEQRAGLYTVDIGIVGGNPVIQYRDRGFLDPLPPAFILPEVLDSSAWLDGKLPFIDKEGLYGVSMTLYPQSPFVYNIDLLSSDELSSYQKLLDPKWKGRFISTDPAQVGGGGKWFSAMIEEDFGPILGLDYMRALAKQEPLIIRDLRLGGEWLLRGKYPFGLNLQIQSQLAEWRRQGIRVPLRDFTPKEGGYVTSGGQSIIFLKNAPNPNAAKVFINWFLSKEGAITITRASIKQSARIDIGDPREIEPQVIMREPGVSYVNPDQEKYLLKTDEHARLASEIFGHLLK